MRCIRVVIADRRPVILQGLSRTLEAQRDFEILARCKDATSCIEAIRTYQPAIAIIGISLPDIDGLEVLGITNSEAPSTRVIFLATSVDDRYLQTLAVAGADAIVSLDVDLEILMQILRRVAGGHRLALPDHHTFGGQCPIEKSVTALTERECQIMRLVSEGLSNKEIGRRLNLTDGTIKVHLHHIFQKLDVGNRTALAAFAMSRGDHSGASTED